MRKNGQPLHIHCIPGEINHNVNIETKQQRKVINSDKPELYVVYIILMTR